MSTISHGGYSRTSCFQIEQHAYVGGDDEGCGGYLEALHVLNAPSDHNPYVLYDYSFGPSGEKGRYAEFESIESAVNAHRASWSARSSDRMREIWETSPEFIRVVDCGSHVPWFYAKQPENVHGDFAVN